MNDQMYHIAIRQEWEQWVAKALENNVSSFGDTKQEALESVQEALALYHEDEYHPTISESVIHNLDLVSLSSLQYA